MIISLLGYSGLKGKQSHAWPLKLHLICFSYWPQFNDSLYFISFELKCYISKWLLRIFLCFVVTSIFIFIILLRKCTYESNFLQFYLGYHTGTSLFLSSLYFFPMKSESISLYCSKQPGWLHGGCSCVGWVDIKVSLGVLYQDRGSVGCSFLHRERAASQNDGMPARYVLQMYWH